MPAPDNLSIIVPPCFYNFLVRGSGERGVVREGVGGRLRAPACSALTRHLPILPTHLYDFSAEEVGGGGTAREVTLYPLVYNLSMQKALGVRIRRSG